MLTLLIEISHNHNDDKINFIGKLAGSQTIACQHEVLIAQLLMEWAAAYSAGNAILGIPAKIAEQVEQFIKTLLPNYTMYTEEDSYKKVEGIVKAGIEGMKKKKEEEDATAEVASIDKNKLH